MNKNNHSKPAYSILVPVVNERENLPDLLEDISDVIEGGDLPQGEIVVVDGGSTDGTQEFVKDEASSFVSKIKLHECEGDGSLSSDLLEGAEEAEGEILVVIDGDRSHPPEKIPDLLNPILQGQKDMMVGSRYVPGGTIEGWTQIRQFISHLSTALARPFVSVRDPLAGFFAVKKDRFLKYGKDSTGFKIGLEIMAQGREDLRVGEVPITFQDRESGESKMGTSEILAFLKQLIRLSGGNLTGGHALRFASVGFLGLLVDASVFYSLLYMSMDLTICHLSGFFTATVFNFTLNANWTFSESYSENSSWPGFLYVKFLSLCLMAFFMRSAILALGVSAVGWAAPPVYLLAIVAGSGVNFVGTALFVFPGESIRESRRLRWTLLSALLILYSVIIRVVYADLLPLLPEEAYYWTWTQHMALSYLDHPPLSSWLMGTFHWFIGHTELALRIPALLSWGVMAYYLYWLAREWFNSISAYFTVALVSAFPLYFGIGFFMTPDPPMYAAWTASLYYLNRAILQNSNQAWYGAGFIAGIGLLSKYTFGLVIFSTFIFLILHKPSRQWFLRKEPYLATLIATIVFSPVIAWNAQNEWISLFFQGTRRWSKGNGYETSFMELVESSMVSLTPLGMIGLFAVFLIVVDRYEKSFFERYLFHPPKRFFAIVFTFVPFSVFLAHSFVGNTKINWTGPVWFAILPWFGHAIIHSEDVNMKWFSKTLRILAVPTLVFFPLLFSGIFYGGWTGYLDLSSNSRVNTQLTNSVDKMIGTVEDLRRQFVDRGRRDEDVYVVGMDKYFLSSWFHFYAEKDNWNFVTGRHHFGKNSLMWSYWDSPEEMKGKTMILYGMEKSQLEVDGLDEYFDKLSEINQISFQLGHDGRDELYWRVGHCFR